MNSHRNTGTENINEMNPHFNSSIMNDVNIRTEMHDPTILKHYITGNQKTIVEFGAGMGMGYMMTGMMNPQMAAAAQQPQAAVPGSMPGSPCSKCGTMIPQGYKFCPNCGAPVNLPPPVQQHACVKCNAQIPSGTRFCPSCGAPQQ